MRVDAELPPPQGKVTQAIADGTAWFSDVNGPRDAPDGIANEMRLSLRRDWIALLRRGGHGADDGQAPARREGAGRPR